MNQAFLDEVDFDDEDTESYDVFHVLSGIVGSDEWMEVDEFDEDVEEQPPLISAILMRDERAISSLIAGRADVNDVQYSLTPLGVALSHYNFRCAQMLLEAKCDVDLRNTKGLTPLMMSVAPPQLYFSFVTPLNDEDNSIRQLHEHAPYNRDAVQFLLAARADVDVKCHDGMTALFWAVKFGNLDAMRDLLAAGANVNARDITGESCLFHLPDNVPSASLVPIIRLLKENGIDIDARNRQQESALLAASRESHTHIMSALIATGADIRVKDAQGSTALTICAQKHNAHGIRLLLDAGLTDDEVNGNGQNNLMMTAANGNVAQLKLFLNHAAPRDEVSNRRMAKGRAERISRVEPAGARFESAAKMVKRQRTNK